jgi:hypothetical protein
MTVKKTQRLNVGEPPTDCACDVWCEDAVGEYQIPYACVWRDGAWYGVGKTKPIAPRVIGWRIHMSATKRREMPSVGRVI